MRHCSLSCLLERILFEWKPRSSKDGIVAKSQHEVSEKEKLQEEEK